MIGRAALAAALLAVVSGCASPPRRPPPLAPPPGGAGPAPRPPPVPLPVPLPAHEFRDGPEAVGVTHRVRAGETIYRIARSHGIDPADLLEANGIADPTGVAVGTLLFIPGARRPSAPGDGPAPAAGRGDAAPAAGRAAREGGGSARAAPRLAWPLHGVLYARFGVRGGRRHDGIDVAAPEGTPIVAAASGTVIYAAEQPGYGVIVILRHEGGLVTLYAHCREALVAEGARVRRGEPIARVGQTGRTTGPHLHFEVREGTRPRNPLLFLP